LLFGGFLLGQGLVKEELIAALDEQQQNKMPMGQMAVQMVSWTPKAFSGF